MAENAEGPPTMSALAMCQAAALIAGGTPRAEVAAALGVDLATLARHIGPVERKAPDGP